jgi:hypothetical protein
MTYREHLQNLLNEAIRKSELYFDVGDDTSERGVPLNGANSDKLRRAHDEWQAAGQAYSSFMEFMERNCIRGDDQMPD